jgi:hypothetical protein
MRTSFGTPDLPTCSRRGVTVDLQLEWHEPFDLVNGQRYGYTYFVEELDELPDAPGVYVFARQHGQLVAPLYVGRAQSISKRVMQQLNNARLMNGIKRAQSGYRLLLVGELIPKPGQQLDRALDIIEAALIRYALAEGFELLNKQGTRIYRHTLRSSGSREATGWLSRCMNLGPGA